jgi:hypothetical protein
MIETLILRLVNPGGKGWALVVGMSLIPLAIGQALKQVGADP